MPLLTHKLVLCCSRRGRGGERSGGPSAPQSRFLHAKGVYCLLDNVMNLEGVEILNSVQVFDSTSCQREHEVLAVNVLKLTFLFV